MTKKILALTGPFVPTNEPMTLIPYKHLRKLDAQIDVVALHYDEDISLKKNLEKDSYFKKFNIKFVGNYNDALFSIKNINLFKALKNIKRYIKESCATFEQGNYDLLYTSSFPIFTHEAGLTIKKKHENVLWIANFTDPINHSPYKEDIETYKNYSFPEKIAFKLYCRYYVKDQVEIDVFDNADLLTFICEEQRDFMLDQYEKYASNHTRNELINKCLILPLNYIQEWENNPTSKTIETNKIVLSHFGRVYGLRKIDNFIRAVSIILNENPSLRKSLYIEQYGEFRKTDKRLIKQLRLEDNFIIHQKIPYEECLNKMRDSYALLIFDTIMSDNDWQPYLPSKVLEYSLLGKNVFALTTQKSPTYRIMKQSGGIVAFDDVLDIKSKLEILLSKKESKLNYKFENTWIKECLENKINDL